MRERSDTEVLDLILAALERGEDPDRIRVAYPDHAGLVERWLGAAKTYAKLVGAARGGAVQEDLVAAGEQLGDFLVEALLARGGEGEVYRARQRSLGDRLVALKVLQGGGRSASVRGRFERESLTLASFHHPNMAEVYGFGEDDGRMFLAMQLIAGPSLLEIQRRLRADNGGDKSPPDADLRPRLVAWVVEVCGALAAVHARGLIHRDVKPSNILIEGGESGGLPVGRAVLVDFGLARPVARSTLTRTGLAPATRIYAPPEQLNGHELDPRADVFALGVTLHDLLTGRLPGERPQASAGMEPLRSLVPDADQDLAAIVARACELEASWRYSDAGELLGDLQAWTNGDRVSARRPPLLERSRRWIQANPQSLLRGLAGLFGAAAVALIMLGLGGWWRGAVHARSAWEGGDLLALDQASTEIPDSLRTLLVREPGLADALARLARDRGDPLNEVVRLLRDQDGEGALRVAATELERNGLDGEPALSRLIFSSLRPQADPDLRSTAIRYAARLFYERPVYEPEQRRAARPWREALTRLRETATLNEEDDLFALSALAGCGDPADVAEILAEAVRHPAGAELERLGLLASAHILYRGLRAGGVEDADLDRLLDLLWPRLLELTVRLSPKRNQYETLGQQFHHLSLLDTLQSIVHARRSRGMKTSLSADLPREWLPEPGGSDPIDWRAHSILLMSGDAYVAKLLRLGVYQELHGGAPSQLSFACLMIGDPELTALTRSRLEREGGVEFAALFDEQLEVGRERPPRASPGPDLDLDTHLVAEPVSPKLVPVGATRSEAPGGTIAAWELRTSVTELSAGATAVETNGRVDADPYSSYLLLSQSGLSRAVLRYEISDGTTPRWAILELDHLDARRPYYPHGGEVQLEILVDGKMLDADRRIDGMDSGGRSLLEIAPRFLTPGPHAIEIRLGRRTNTTYRLLRAALVWFEGSPPIGMGSLAEGSRNDREGFCREGRSGAASSAIPQASPSLCSRPRLASQRCDRGRAQHRAPGVVPSEFPTAPKEVPCRHKSTSP